MTDSNEQAVINPSSESRNVESEPVNGVTSTAANADAPTAPTASAGDAGSLTTPAGPTGTQSNEHQRSRDGAEPTNVSIDAPPATANPNISNIDGVFANMQATTNYPKEMTKVVTISNSSSQEDILPKYEDVAHLSPPKYSDIFRNNPSLISSLDFNEVELNGLIVGGYEVFFGFCTLTLVFNIVGFFVSMLLSDSYAGKYGSCCGLGLLIVASGIFNFPFSFNHREQHIGKGRDVWNKTLSISFICLGALTCVLCFALYRRIRNEITRYSEIGATA